MSTQYYNPCGLLAMGSGVLGIDFAKHVDASDYTAVCIIDHQETASKLNLPYNIFRAFGYEPHPTQLPATATEQQRIAQARADAKKIFDKVLPWALQYPNTHIYINNEVDFTKARLDMYAELIHLTMAWAQQNATKPIGYVFGNFASGSIKCGQGPRHIIDEKTKQVIHTNDNTVAPTGEEILKGWREPNHWISNGERFLRALHQYRNEKTVHGGYAFILGDHQYTMFTPWYSTDGGDFVNVFNWKDRPKRIDWAKAQWHIGRTAQALMQASKVFGISMPWMIITESLIDFMDDVDERINLGFKPRGYKTYANVWKQWFPDFDTVEEAYAEMLIWAWETVYAPLGNVLATLTFSYGSTGDWGTYQVDVPAGNEYLAIMEDYRYIPLPTVDEIPLPVDAGNKVKAFVQLPVPEMNVRAGNSVFFKVRGLVKNGATVYHYPTVNMNGWTYIETLDGTLKGWLSLQNGGVHFSDIVEPPLETTFNVDIEIAVEVEAETQEQAVLKAMSMVRFNVTPK